MVIGIVFAHIWTVIELIILGSFARTIRMRTALAAIAVGLYACAPAAALLEVTWTQIAAPVIGVAAPELIRTASYTLDPFVEEIIKLLPLAALLLVPVIRRQWSLTDYVLIAAATGGGFGLAEDLYRFSAAAGNTQAIPGGWAVQLTRTYAFVPSILHSLSSWLPVGVAIGPASSRLDAHVAWSALGGLAVGLMMMRRRTAARATAAGLLLCIGLDHAAGNTTYIGSTWLALLAGPLALVARLRGMMPIAALVGAWWLDRQRTTDDLQLLLAAERTATPRLSGTLTAAVARLPWSIGSVDRFVRMRRAYAIERASAGSGAASLTQATVGAARHRVDRELADPRAYHLLVPSSWSADRLHEMVRQPAVGLWLVVLAPPLLWFVLGGWPSMARLQAVMVGSVVWKLVFPIALTGQAWLAWRVFASLRAWPHSRSLPNGDDTALMALRLACGLGALGLGAFSTLRLLAGLSPASSLLAGFHAAEAANRMTPGGGMMMAGTAAAASPPPLPGEAADASAPSSSTSADSSADPAAAPAPAAAPPGRPKAPPAEPRPSPAEQAAAAAKDNAITAAADAIEADQRRQRAIQRAESAGISQAAADPGSDPDVAAAQERARQAHEAADAADRDFDDPWDDAAPKKAAADAAHRDLDRAEADRKAAEDEFWDKKQSDVDAAKAAEEQATNDAFEARTQAAAAQAEADAQARAAEDAAAQSANAAARAADPEGAAADDAAAAHAEAERRANQAFFDTHPATNHDYRDALDQVQAAKEKADAAKAAADAAHAAREGNPSHTTSRRRP